MGSIFINIIKETLPNEWSTFDLEGNLLKKGYASFLDKIVRKLPKEHRKLFPILKKLEIDSGFYIGENLYLNKEEVKTIKNEFDTIMEIINKKIFLKNVTAENLLLYIGQDSFPPPTVEETINELLLVKGLIDFAVKNECAIYVTR